jgi:carboxyl-terminal processing protease
VRGERDLPNHLKGEFEDEKNSERDGASDGLLDDYALNEALIVLKGMALRHAPAAAPAAAKTR